MTMLEQYPLHVRRKIALGITIGIAAVLLGAMILVYTSDTSDKADDTTAGKIGQFYATILESAQSYFGSERGIMPK